MTTLTDLFDYDAKKARYLTHVSPRHNAVFVEVPKAGCTTVKRLLQYAEVDGRVEDLPADVHRREQSPLQAPEEGNDLDYLFGPGSDFFRFAFVRNPFTRSLSCYLDKIVGNPWERDIRLPQLGFSKDAYPTFVEFLEAVAAQDERRMDIHWTPQSRLLSLDTVSYHFLGRFEAFQADLRRVQQRVGLRAPDGLITERPHATDASEKVRQYYDDKATALVLEIYGTDFSRLGYGVDPLMA